MSFEKKVTVLFLFLVAAVPIFLYYAAHRSRPEPTPIPPREEVTITIIPGWNARDVAQYLVKMRFASTSDDVFGIIGEPAHPESSKAPNLEGSLAPETYRVYRDATLAEVIKKLLDQRTKELSEITGFSSSSEARKNEILTMASLIEDEARTPEDRRLISDILWRRLKKGWALQLDSTVHYAVAKTGTVFTTDKERNVNSPYNTYKYPGLPPGPICNPSVDSIEAALEPTANQYWFFLTGNDGKMYYAKTLEEHTANRYKYLR